MSTPIPYDYRVKIVKLRESGMVFSAIAEEVSYSVKSVKRIWHRYSSQGEEGLKTNYANCGRRSDYSSTLTEKITSIRDNQQGAPYVRSLLMENFPSTAVPHERTLQRWWKKQGTQNPRGRPKKKSTWTNQANHTWQIDGKGPLILKTDEKVSWIKIADEGTSSDLDTRLFPPEQC